jgi:DNA recombination protein RmuC
MSIAAMLIGLLVGAAGVWLTCRSRLAAGDEAARTLRGVEQELAGAIAELEVERRSASERLDNAVKALSADALRENNAAFLALAETKLSGYVAPLKESLEKVDGQVRVLEQGRERAFGALREELGRLREDSRELRTATGSLATALRAPHVRGRWGEVGLRNVVEAAGLVEHCDFDEQASTRDAEGSLLRPDLVVRLPGGKRLVVDSKVPLDAYLDALESEDPAHRAEALARHARPVRDHVAKLAAKAYWRQFDPTPDFVVMVLPDETFLRAAQEHDRRLNEDAWASGVVIASPTLLFGLLRTVAATWQQETVAQSARQVHALGQELYDRLATLAGHVGAVGRSLTSAVSHYNKAVGTLETRVLVTGRRLQQHGVVGDAIPDLEPIDLQARMLQAPELTEARDDGPPRALDAA